MSFIHFVCRHPGVIFCLCDCWSIYSAYCCLNTPGSNKIKMFYLLIIMIMTCTFTRSMIGYCDICLRKTINISSTHVNCSRNGLGYWPNELQYNATSVTSLDMSWNNLWDIDAKLLNGYPNLLQLMLAGNQYLGFVGCVQKLSHVQVAKPRRLSLDRVSRNGEIVHHGDFNENFFCAEFFKRLTHLSVRANNIVSFHAGVFHCVPNLQFFAAGFNYILTVEPRINLRNIAAIANIPFPYHFMRRLEKFDLSRLFQHANLYDDVFNDIYDPDEVFLFSTEKIYENDLDVTDPNSNLTYFNKFHLKYLYITHLQLPNDWQASPFGHLPTLEYLDLSHNQGSQVLVSSITDVPNLRIVNCSICGLSKLKDDIFVDIPHLIELNLSHNSLGNVHNNFSEIFKPLTELEILSLAFNKLSSLQKTAFIALKSLKHIDLSGNNLQKIDLRWTSQEITVIDLYSNNLIEEFLGPDARQSISNISSSVKLIIGPQLICSCNSTDFFVWLNENKQVDVPSLTSSNCSFNGISISLLDAHEYLNSAHECTGINIIIPVTTAAGLFGAFVLALSIVIHRYKIYITWFIYRLKHRFCDRKIFTSRSERSLHDVYIGLAYEDLLWVKDIILPYLENVKGFKVYLYERDSEPGNTIADNIVYGLSNSACVIVILSPHFMRDEWRDFELSMAVASGKSRIAIVKTGDITAPDLKMNLILKSLILPNPRVTFHEWDPGTCGNRLLYDTLGHHIVKHAKHQTITGDRNDDLTGNVI